MRLAVTLIVLLTACETTPTTAEICTGYGFTQGTSAHANCQMDYDQAERQRRLAILGAIKAPRLEMPRMSAPVMTTPSITTCQWMGNQMVCYGG